MQGRGQTLVREGRQLAHHLTTTTESPLRITMLEQLRLLTDVLHY